MLKGPLKATNACRRKCQVALNALAKSMIYQNEPNLLLIDAPGCFVNNVHATLKKIKRLFVIYFKNAIVHPASSSVPLDNMEKN